MKAVAWDTSSKSGTLVAVEWDENDRSGRFGLKLVSEWTLNVDATHSDRLLWAVDQLLKASQWTLDEVDLFGVGLGPGSFTGLRIGLTTARTLAHTLGKPLIGFSSLAALVRPVASWLAEFESRVIVIGATDACKGELYTISGAARSVRECVMAKQGDFSGLWSRGVDESVLTPDELVKRVKKKLSEGLSAKQKSKESSIKWIAVGNGTERYAEAWAMLPKKQKLDVPIGFSGLIQGRAIAELVFEVYQAGLARSALSVFPNYVRAPDAELRLKAGLLKPAPRG